MVRKRNRRKKRSSTGMLVPGGRITTDGFDATRVATSAANESVTRLVVRGHLNEVKLGTIMTFTLSASLSLFPSIKAYAAYRVKRVGVGVMPGSYLEWLVRAAQRDGINTRGELVDQPDCELIRNTYGGMYIKWYRPLEATFRGWQEVVPTGNIVSGLYMIYTGQNDLTPEADGILAIIMWDLELRHPSIGNAVYDAPTEVLERELALRRTRVAVDPHAGLNTDPYNFPIPPQWEHRPMSPGSGWAMLSDAELRANRGVDDADV